MSSYPIRDPKADRLLTPQNAALVIIDYQPTQINSINSIDRSELIRNIVILAKLCVNYKLPVVLSTVNVSNGRNRDTIPALKEALSGITSYDRTSINAWEDKEFNDAVKATGRKKLIMAALWTEACLTFPSIDAMKEGYEIYPVVDALGGTSKLAHDTALAYLTQQGAHITTIPQLACELQRDWNRTDTVKFMVETLQDAGVFLKLG